MDLFSNKTAKSNKKNDEEFMIELYESYYPLMKAKAVKLTGDINVSDDIVQNAIIKLINNIKTVRNLNFYERTAYIVHTVKSVSYDYLRRNGLGMEKEEIYENMQLCKAEELSADSPEEIYLKKEQSAELDTIMSRLSERDRQLMSCKYFEEMTESEISDELGIPTHYISTYVFRAKERIRRLLEE